MSSFTNAYTSASFKPSQYEKTEDGFLRVRARVLAERVMDYAAKELVALPEELKGQNVIPMLVNRESMGSGDAFRTLEGAQVVAPEHVWVEPSNSAVSKGNTAGAACLDGPYLCIDMVITDPETIRMIEAGEIGEISAGYHAESVFENGDFDGIPYSARQTQLRFNHIAVIPYGEGRAGSDVRIINHKKSEGGKIMPEFVRVKLRNGKYVNTDEEGAKAIEEDSSATDSELGESSKSIETSMKQLEDKNGELADVQSEVEELKGELSVYKEKLEELLSDEAVEAAANEMVAEQGEAEEILENSLIKDGEGNELPQDEKEKVKNSCKGLRGDRLYRHVLGAVGVKVENMSAEGCKGAFKAHSQIIKNGAFKKVSGVRLMGGMKPAETPAGSQKVRNSREKLGLK